MVHFYDLINNGNFSAEQEMESLITLLEKKGEFKSSIRKLFDENFIRFSNRGPFTSLTKILDYLISQSRNQDELLILFCEMLLSYIEEYEKLIHTQQSEDSTFMFLEDTILDIRYLKKHIYGLVDRLNHKIVNKDGSFNFIIIPKEKKSIQAAEVVACTDEDIAIKILEYKHFSTTVDDKEKILFSIAKYMEDKKSELTNSLNEDDLYIKGNKKIKIIDQMFEMFNSLHIRHQSDNQYIEKSEREKWYDYTYNTVLTVIIISEQAKINKEFKKLKDSNRKR